MALFYTHMYVAHILIRADFSVDVSFEFCHLRNADIICVAFNANRAPKPCEFEVFGRLLWGSDIKPIYYETSTTTGWLVGTHK